MRVLLVLAILLAAPGVAATLTDPLQNDAGTGGDAGDSFATATRLDAPNDRLVQGVTFAVDDPQDWYVFALATPTGTVAGPLRLVYDVHGSAACASLPASTMSHHVELVDPDGVVRAHADSVSCSTGGGLTIQPPLTSGDWRVSIQTRSSPVDPLPGTGSTAAQGQESSAQDAYSFILGCKPSC